MIEDMQWSGAHRENERVHRDQILLAKHNEPTASGKGARGVEVGSAAMARRSDLAMLRRDRAFQPEKEFMSMPRQLQKDPVGAAVLVARGVSLPRIGERNAMSRAALKSAS